MKPDLVVLTGFMATGKSAVGRLLAVALAYEWVDTDALIEDRHGPIHEIFRSNGEEAFRQMERRLADDLANRKGLVISTGGRMMLDPEIRESLGAAARVFCLSAEPAEIQRRVTNQDGPERPLLGTNAAARIADLLAERAEGYAAFEQVPTDGISVEEVVRDIMTRLHG